MIPPVVADAYAATQEEREEDKALDAYLADREDVLIADFRLAKDDEHLPSGLAAGAKLLSDATAHSSGEPGTPRYSTEEVLSWVLFAREREGSLLGLGDEAQLNHRVMRETFHGLLRSKLMPTMPLREVVARFMVNTKVAFVDIAGLAAEELDRLTGSTGGWLEGTGDRLRYDLGMRSKTNTNQQGVESTTVKSFICIDKASAIAFAIQTTPIEIGA